MRPAERRRPGVHYGLQEDAPWVAARSASPRAQEVRALLVGRKLLRGKLLLSIQGILRGFGLKVGVVSKGRFACGIRDLVTGQAMLERVIEPMLRAREALRAEYHALHRAMLGIVREDTTCRRLMRVPGVATLIAITFTWAIDYPGRFTRDPERWALTSASRRRSTSPARPTLPAGSARWVTPWCGAQI